MESEYCFCIMPMFSQGNCLSCFDYHEIQSAAYSESGNLMYIYVTSLMNAPQGAIAEQAHSVVMFAFDQ